MKLTKASTYSAKKHDAPTMRFKEPETHVALPIGARERVGTDPDAGTLLVLELEFDASTGLLTTLLPTLVAQPLALIDLLHTKEAQPLALIAPPLEPEV